MEVNALQGLIKERCTFDANAPKHAPGIAAVSGGMAKGLAVGESPLPKLYAGFCIKTAAGAC